MLWAAINGCPDLRKSQKKAKWPKIPRLHGNGKKKKGKGKKKNKKIRRTKEIPGQKQKHSQTEKHTVNTLLSKQEGNRRHIDNEIR